MNTYAGRVAIIIGTLALGGLVLAGEDASEKPKEAKPKNMEAVLQDLTLTGKVEKTQKDGKDGQKIDVYRLVVADGEPIVLPWKKREGSSLMNLDEYVGKEVKISAEGEVIQKSGKKKTLVKKIISVEPVEGAAANTPPPPPAE